MAKGKYKNFHPLNTYDKDTFSTLKNLQLIILFQLIICGFLLPEYLKGYKEQEKVNNEAVYTIAQKEEKKEKGTNYKAKEEAYNFNKDVFEVILSNEQNTVKALNINPGNAELKLSSDKNINNLISKIDNNPRLKIADIEFHESSSGNISLTITKR